LTGLRELEVVHLFWSDISFELQTVRVTAKPDLGFYPKRWEEREVPIPVQLIDLLKAHTRSRLQFRVFVAQKGIANTTCSTTAKPWPNARSLIPPNST
jgi:integrase